MTHKERIKALRYLSLLTQFGLSVAMPPLICVFAALMLQKHFGVGNWVMICAIVVGFISSACTFVNFVKTYSKKESGEHDDKNGSGRQERDD